MILNDSVILYFHIRVATVEDLFTMNMRLTIIFFVAVFNQQDNMSDFVRQLQRFNVGEDCPVFDGLFEFCQLYASGSIGK